MNGITFLRCSREGCGKEFRKGTGHLVACHCGSSPICHDCYLELKSLGFLRDRKFKQSDISKEIKKSGK